MDKLTGVYDIEFIYPNEKEIIRFLDKIYSIPYDHSKSWEKEIYCFFQENPFVVSFISRSLEDNFPDIKNYFSELMSLNLFIWDSEDMYKELVKIRESVRMNRPLLKKYWEFLFMNSCMLRKMLTKVIDEEDSGFNKYKTALMPYKYEMRFKEKPDVLVYENIVFFCADGSLDYNFDSIQKEVSSKFDKKLNKLSNLNNKNNEKPKRRPLDSRLRHECFKRDNYTCKECGATNKDKTLHADHIIPFSKGGTDELCNLQTLCDDCNLAKSDKHFIAGKEEIENAN